MSEEYWYAVTIESQGPEMEDSLLGSFMEALEERSDVAGPVVSWGGIAGGPGATVSVRAPDPAEAAARAMTAFLKAAADAGIDASPMMVESMAEPYRDAWLDQPPVALVGLAEVARGLGVSKQRVTELRRREDFPKPVAELAAGPVWTEVSLNHFVAGWERRPGRPPRSGDGGD